jgi:hypothetical protein
VTSAQVLGLQQRPEVQTSAAEQQCVPNRHDCPVPAQEHWHDPSPETLQRDPGAQLSPFTPNVASHASPGCGAQFWHRGAGTQASHWKLHVDPCGQPGELHADGQPSTPQKLGGSQTSPGSILLLPQQRPQSMVPPHPSSTTPHAPCAHVAGVQPHACATPPPPHVCGAVHDPQSSVPPQPSASGPHVAPAAAHVVGVHGTVVVVASVVELDVGGGGGATGAQTSDVFRTVTARLPN